MMEAPIKTKVLLLLADPFAGHGLTKKEAEAARLIALGLGWEEAAEMLGVSKQALAARLKGACKKLNIKNSKQLTKELFKRLAAILNDVRGEEV